MLQDVSTGKHPTVIGPVFIHQQTFLLLIILQQHSLAITRNLEMLFALVQMEIKHWSKLLHITFPMHFNCGVLFTLKRMYKRNCALLAFPVQCLIADIFGKQTGSVYREGLVDCVRMHSIF